MIALDRPPTTLQSLVDDLLLRQHVAELEDELERHRTEPRSVQMTARRAQSGSAS